MKKTIYKFEVTHGSEFQSQVCDGIFEAFEYALKVHETKHEKNSYEFKIDKR